MSDETTTPTITELPAQTVPVQPAVNPMGIVAENYRQMLIAHGINPDTGETVPQPATEESFDEVMDSLTPDDIEYVSERMKELPVIADLLSRVEALEQRAKGI